MVIHSCVGILGPDRTSDAMAVSRLISSLPNEKRLLQFSGSATGKQLSDGTVFPNFFRVTPPDDTQVEVCKIFPHVCCKRMTRECLSKRRGRQKEKLPGRQADIQTRSEGEGGGKGRELP